MTLFPELKLSMILGGESNRGSPRIALCLSYHIWRINYTIRDFGEWMKLCFAWTILCCRRRSTVSLRWVSERLRMEHYTRVTQSLRRAERRPGRKINQIKRKLEQLER